jgi:hypothetical protein
MENRVISRHGMRWAGCRVSILSAGSFGHNVFELVGFLDRGNNPKGGKK